MIFSRLVLILWIRYHLKDIKDKPEEGVLIYGLYLEGCRWDENSHKLCESLPKQLYTDIPLIHFLPQANRPLPENWDL